MNDESRTNTPEHARPTAASYLLILLLVAAGGVIAGTRPFGMPRDYLEYREYFDLVRARGCGEALARRFEPGFALAICWLAKLDGITSELTFALVAAAGLALKLPLLRKAGSFAWCAYILYFCRFFPLHELMQLRAGLSIGILYWGIYWIIGSQRLLGTTSHLLAASFHFSAPIISGLSLMVYRVRARTSALLSVLVVGGITAGYLVQALQIASEYRVAGSFTFKQSESLVVNTASVGLWFDLALFGAWLSQWSELDEHQRVFLAVFGIGFGVIFSATAYPVVAWRLAEMTEPALCFLIARSRTPTQRALGLATVLVQAPAYAYLFATREYFF